MLSRWPDDIRIAVNFSAVQFQNVGILQTIVDALAEANVAPNRLEIEITESMLISKYGSAPAILHALLELGLTVALDDFGTGFSSLTYLRKLPFSRIKIDQSFIRDMAIGPESGNNLRCAINHQLGAAVSRVNRQRRARTAAQQQMPHLLRRIFQLT